MSEIDLLDFFCISSLPVTHPMSTITLEERLKNAIKIMCRRNSDCVIELTLEQLMGNDENDLENLILKIREFEPHKKQIYLEVLFAIGLCFYPPRFMMMALSGRSIDYPDLRVLVNANASPNDIKELRNQSLKVVIQTYSKKEIECIIKTCFSIKKCSLVP